MPTLFDRAIAGVLPAVPRPVVRKVSSRYIAGESFDDVVRIARELRGAGLRCTMDILGENTHSPEQARQAAADYLALVDRQAEVDVDRNVSIKLSQLGLALDRQLCLDGMRGIVARSAALGGKVRIDMEDSPVTDRTIAIYERLRDDFANTGLVLQAYLYRTEGDVRRLMEAGRGHFRLCKGAYDEPPEVAWQEKADVDSNLVKLMTLMLDSRGAYPGVYPALASHDHMIINWTKAYAYTHNISPDRFEFQMLYGIRRDLQQQLADQGYRMRVYIPYGTRWYPYYMRRLAERPANVVFFARAMFGN